MRVQRRLAAFVAAGIATGALALAGVATGRPLSALLILPWAAFLSGPAAMLLLVRPLLEAWEPWLRRFGLLIPGASAAFVLVEATGSLARAATRVTTDALALLHVGLLAAELGALVFVWRLAIADERRDIALAGAAFLLLGLLPWTRDAVPLALLAMQALAFLGLAGFRWSVRAWTRAAVVGGGILVAGLLLLMATRGRLLPPALALDAADFTGFVVPLAVAALLVSLVTLLLLPDPLTGESAA
jgi:hypothetical protein